MSKCHFETSPVTIWQRYVLSDIIYAKHCICVKFTQYSCCWLSQCSPGTSWRPYKTSCPSPHPWPPIAGWWWPWALPHLCAARDRPWPQCAAKMQSPAGLHLGNKVATCPWPRSPCVTSGRHESSWMCGHVCHPAATQCCHLGSSSSLTGVTHWSGPSHSRSWWA